MVEGLLHRTERVWYLPSDLGSVLGGRQVSGAFEDQ